MKITGKTRAAIKVLMIMATHQERLSVREIAEMGDVPVRYLEQIVALLKKGQFIESMKGAGGGYQLIKETNGISMWDIIMTIDGENYFSSDESDAISDVINDKLFKPLDKTIKTCLSQLTLDQLIVEYKKRTHQEYMYYI